MTETAALSGKEPVSRVPSSPAWTGLVGLTVLAGLYLTTFYSYLLFHCLAELFSIVIAQAVFMFALNTRRYQENDYLLFLGTALFFVSILDLVHTMAYAGMDIFHGFGANLPTQLWIASRGLLSFSFLAAPLFLTRRLRFPLCFWFFALVTALVLFSTLYWPVFPTCFVEGQGLTPFKKISEYCISLILLLSLGTLYSQRRLVSPAVYSLLSWAIILSVIAELSFSFYFDVYRLSDMIGHYFKIISFYFIYEAILATGIKEPYALIFKEFKEAHDELSSANEQLSREIAERRLAEESLRRQEKFTGSLLENIPDGVVACEADGMLSLFNRAARDWHGLDSMALPPEQWAEHYNLYGPDGKTPLTSETVPLARAFRGEEVRNAEMSIVAKGQPPRFILANASPFFDENGKKLGAVTVMMDVTRRRKVEEELRRAKEELELRVDKRTNELRTAYERLQEELVERQRAEQALQLTQFSMDSAADAIFWIRQDATIFYVNTSACLLLGYSREEFLRLTAADINPAHPFEKWQEHWQQLRQQGKLTFEASLRCKDGQLIEVEISANYLEFQGEAYNCAYVRDTTARKRAEWEIKKVATEWSTAMDSSPDAIYLLDLDRCVLRANKAFYAMTGLTPETALGRHVASIIHPQGEMVPCPICAAQEEKRDLVTTMEADHPDNPAGRPIEVSLTIVRDSAQKPISMFMILHDLSQERQVQQELAGYREHLEELVTTRTAELEEKNAELQRLNKLFVGRELRMIELKGRIRELEEEGGENRAGKRSQAAREEKTETAGHEEEKRKV